MYILRKRQNKTWKPYSPGFQESVAAFNTTFELLYVLLTFNARVSCSKAKTSGDIF